VDFIPNSISILLFALLISGFVYVGLRLLFRSEDSPRTKRAIKITVLTTLLVAYAILGFVNHGAQTAEPVPSGGTLTLETGVELTISVEVATWQDDFAEYELTWPPPGELAAPVGDQQIIGSISGTSTHAGLAREATIGVGGAGITGFKCVIQGIKDQAATESFFQTCWAAAKIEGADIALGSEWVAEAVDSIYNPSSEADISQLNETVCPAELTMIAVASSDATQWITFNILPAITGCDSATND
jgi:hypothetical protein